MMKMERIESFYCTLDCPPRLVALADVGGDIAAADDDNCQLDLTAVVVAVVLGTAVGVDTVVEDHAIHAIEMDKIKMCTSTHIYRSEK